MPLFTETTKPMSDAEIIARLRELRSRSWAPYSQYHVAAIAEIELSGNKYLYTGGVNDECDEDNNLSVHGEQSAVINALSLLGGDIKFSKIWIMAAPANATPEEAESAAKPCGHCRQILLDLAKPEAKIYVVTLSGKISSPDTFENGFLPDPFGEKDLGIIASANNQRLNLLNIFKPKLKIWELLQKYHLPIEVIDAYLQLMVPHIVSEKFKTSPVTAAIFECHDRGYAVGGLVQNVAFLPTSAIAAAIANAIVLYGGEDLLIEKIHLKSSKLDPDQLTMTEMEMLRRFSGEETRLYFHAQSEIRSYPLKTCMRARLAKSFIQLQENSIKFSTTAQEDVFEKKSVFHRMQYGTFHLECNHLLVEMKAKAGAHNTKTRVFSI